MPTGDVQLQGVTIVAPVKATLQGLDYRRNILKGITIAVGTGAQIMQLKVVDRNHEPIEGATCRVLNAVLNINDNVPFLDGVDDYMQASAALIPTTGDFIISMYLKNIPNDSPNTNQGLVTQWVSGQAGRFSPVWGSNNKIRFDIGGSTVCGTSTLNTNQWYFIELIRSGNNWSIKVDGVTDGMGSRTVTLSNTNTQIGTFGTLAVSSFNGHIAGVKIETGSGIQNDWPLNEGEGTTGFDAVGSNNLTFFGTTWEEDEDYPGAEELGITGYDPTPYDTGTTNANGLTTLNYQINTIHGLEVTLPGKRRFIMPFQRTTRGLLDWQVMLSDYLATFATDRGNILINSEPENNDANFLIE